MTFRITPIDWLEHGAGEAKFQNGPTIRNLNNINTVQVKLDGIASTVGLDEFVDALNQIGFTVSAKADPALGETKTLGVSSDPFAAAWERAEQGPVKVGDRVISRMVERDGYSYGTFTPLSPLNDARIRVLERKPEPEPIPEWVKGARVIKALLNDNIVIAERDDEDDWLVYSLDADDMTGEYVMGHQNPEAQFSEVEVLVAA